jgi:hypothetical protein
METHFPKLPMHSSCADVTSRGSFELGSELGGPVLWACVAYHFMAELLLLLAISTSQ